MSNLITVNNGAVILDAEANRKIAEFERLAKLIKEEETKLKDAILEEMQEKGILKVETENLIITYIAPTDRERFDTKRFRAEHSDLHDEYVTMSKVKASVRIKVKEGDK